jgi:hypothetical protein
MLFVSSKLNLKPITTSFPSLGIAPSNSGILVERKA